MCTNSYAYGVGDRVCECKIAKSFNVMQRFNVVCLNFYVTMELLYLHDEMCWDLLLSDINLA